MYEKVNPAHPDKVADRIAGALVDYAYTQQENPRVAFEVLIGHGLCIIMGESSVDIPIALTEDIVKRISGQPNIVVTLNIAPQDVHLAENQKEEIRCGDNGIFKGTPVTEEQKELTKIARDIYNRFKTDGKYLLDVGRLDEDMLTICQSNLKDNDEQFKAYEKDLKKKYKNIIVNPLGEWTGSINVDSGATNRKIGSDMGDSVTGGGLMGKDLSKADVSVNIYCWVLAQLDKEVVVRSCSIGDREIEGVPYSEIVKVARDYIQAIGGFEKFAEWGLIRPESLKIRRKRSPEGTSFEFEVVG